MKNLAKYIVAAVLASGAMTPPSFAQQPAKSKSPARSAQTTPNAAPVPATPTENASPTPVPGWAPRCGSISRDAPLECAIEQTAVLTKTGQTVVLVNIRVPSDTRAPVITIQLPLGLFLPAGAAVQVDDGKTTNFQIQTCEQRGCYAGGPLAADLIAAMKSGKEFKVSFQNLSKESIAIPLPLNDFASAYDKIK